jgi:hypothetical protein
MSSVSDGVTNVWCLQRTSFLQEVQIMRVSIGTNGTAALEGYKTDGGTAAAAIIGGSIAEGVARGLRQ